MASSPPARNSARTGQPTCRKTVVPAPAQGLSARSIGRWPNGFCRPTRTGRRECSGSLSISWRSRETRNFRYSAPTSRNTPASDHSHWLCLLQEQQALQGMLEFADGARHVIIRCHDQQRGEAVGLRPAPRLDGIADGVAGALAEIDAARQDGSHIASFAGDLVPPGLLVNAADQKPPAAAFGQQAKPVRQTLRAARQHHDAVSALRVARLERGDRAAEPDKVGNQPECGTKTERENGKSSPSCPSPDGGNGQCLPGRCLRIGCNIMAADQRHAGKIQSKRGVKETRQSRTQSRTIDRMTDLASRAPFDKTGPAKGRASLRPCP